MSRSIDIPCQKECCNGCPCIREDSDQSGKKSRFWCPTKHLRHLFLIPVSCLKTPESIQDLFAVHLLPNDLCDHPSLHFRQSEQESGATPHINPSAKSKGQLSFYSRSFNVPAHCGSAEHSHQLEGVLCGLGTNDER